MQDDCDEQKRTSKRSKVLYNISNYRHDSVTTMILHVLTSSDTAVTAVSNVIKRIAAM